MRGIHIEVVPWVLGQQVLLPFAQQGCMLCHVLAVDAQHGLFVFERIGPEAAIRLEALRSLGQPPGVGRDAAIGIGCLDRSERGQGGAQLLGLLRCHGRESWRGKANGNQRKDVVEFHDCSSRESERGLIGEKQATTIGCAHAAVECVATNGGRTGSVVFGWHGHVRIGQAEFMLACVGGSNAD